MKRFQLLVLVAAITAAVIWWNMYRSHHTSSAAVTTLLPQDTLAFVHLPDFNRSREEFHRTDLYQLWTEPAMRDFLQKPRAQIPTGKGLNATIQECASLQMKDAFLALIAIDSGTWKLVGGFRFKGDSAQAERTVASWTAKLLGKAPDFREEIVDYEGHKIRAETAGVVRLFSVRNGQWFFLANDLEQLKPLLDRVDRRIKDQNAALVTNDTFAAAFKHMPSSYAALVFTRVDRFFEKLVPRSEKETTESADQMAAIRQIRSLCSATAFEGGKIRDTLFVGMPRLLDAGSLTRASLPVGTKDTFLYTTGFMNLTKPIPIPGSPATLGWMGGLQKIRGSLLEHGVTLDSWNAAFGPEFSCVGIWPSNSHWPSLFATLPVQDFATANKILSAITTAKPNSVTWTRQEKDGVQYFSTRAGGKFFSPSPTIGLSDRMLVAGTDAGSVEAAMMRISKGNSELADLKMLQIADRWVPTAQDAFAYVDPALVYTRIDATLRPVLFMSAAFLPGIADTIDLDKLPTPETTTKHLSPIVMSQRYDHDGYISESVGPITLGQTIVGAGGLGGALSLIYSNYKQTPEVADISTGPASFPAASASASHWTSKLLKNAVAPSPSPAESPE